MVSSNVVGYQKLAINPTWTMVAAPIVEVGTDSTAGLNDLFAKQEEVITGGENDSLSDNLQLWTGSSYAIYYFGDWGNGDEYDGKWYDLNDDADPTEDNIPSGNGAWFKNYSGAAKEVTVSGEVSAEDKSVAIGAAWTMLAYPYPADLPLNGVVDWAAAGATGGENDSLADNIQLWNGTTYKVYYFGDWGNGDEYDGKWYDLNDDAEPTEDVIPAGTAVWYKNSSGTPFTVTFESPVK